MSGNVRLAESCCQSCIQGEILNSVKGQTVAFWPSLHLLLFVKMREVQRSVSLPVFNDKMAEGVFLKTTLGGCGKDTGEQLNANGPHCYQGWLLPITCPVPQLTAVF